MPIKPTKIAGVLGTPTETTKFFRNFTRGQLFVNGLGLGELSSDELTISPDQNTAEVITGDGPQGTKPSDIVVTGSVLTMTGAFSASGVNVQTLSQLSDTVFDQNDGNRDAGYLGANLFVPKTKVPVKIVAIDETLQRYSVREEDIINLYEVDFTIEKIFSANSGEAATVAFTAMVYQKIFDDGERINDGPGSAAGYWGQALIARVPKMDWPDKIPPFLNRVAITNATTLTFTLSRAAKLATGQNLSSITIRDDNGTSPGTPTNTQGPTLTASSATITQTYANGTFTANSEYTVTIPAGTLVSDIAGSTYIASNIEQKRTTENSIT